MLACLAVSLLLAAAPGPVPADTVAAAVPAAAAAPAAKANPFLAQAKVLYQGLNYEKALDRLKKAMAWTGTSQAEMAEIHLYRGLSHLQLGREKQGREALRAAVLADADVRLPPMCSPKLASVFNEEAAAVRPAAPPPPVEVAPPPVAVAVAPPVVEPAPNAAPAGATAPPAEPAVVKKEHVRWPSYVAFAAAVVLAGVGGYMGYDALERSKQATDAQYADDHVRLNGEARQRADLANGLYGAAGGVAALGLVFLFTF